MIWKPSDSRRDFIRLSTGVGLGLIVSSCASGQPASSSEKAENTPAPQKNDKEAEVTATEDLMREHGILRRAFLIYQETAVKLRTNSSALLPEALQKTAKLFRTFGEDYHEKALEETYIFPAVKKAGGAAAAYTDILLAQHQRGREITDFIIAATQNGKISTNNIEPLAKAMEAFALMYQNHAAREDTIIFPAWKQTMNAKQLDEIGDKFEDIEHVQFGKDGFEDAVRQIGEIENSLGFADLAQFTAPPPPKL